MERFTKRFCGDLRAIAVGYPVELFTLVCYALLAVVAGCKVDGVVESAPYCWATLFVVYGLNSLSRRGYWLSALLPICSSVGLFFYDVEFNDTRLLVALLCSMLFAIVAQRSGENRAFVTSSAAMLRNILFAGVSGTLVVGLILSVLLSLDMIFGCELLKGASVWVTMSSVYLILPIAFLYFERSSQGVNLQSSSFFRFLINYILTPSVLIYSVIMYAYFVKIVWAWSLPNGVITATAVTYLMLGIVTKASRQLVDSAPLEWLFRYFTYLSLPALVMLWVSAYIRISNYGMTGDRGYLIALLLIASAWCLSMISSRLYNYLRLTIFAVVVMMSYTIAGYDYFESNKVDRVVTKESDGRQYLVRNERVKLDLEVRGMSNLYDNVKCRIDGETLYIEQLGEVLVELSTRDVLTEIYARAEVDHTYINMSAEERASLCRALYYEGRDVVVVFSSMTIKGLAMKRASVDYILVR